MTEDLLGSTCAMGTLAEGEGLHFTSGCRTRWVLQEDAYGCGVACLAMVSGAPYSEVRALFVRGGMGAKQIGHRPFASNFWQLMAIGAELGLRCAMQRWKGWDSFDGVGIIKVPSTKPGWHWMVAERTSIYGVMVLDPALDWPAFDRAPLNVMYRSPQSLQPYGNWIAIRSSCTLEV